MYLLFLWERLFYFLALPWTTWRCWVRCVSGNIARIRNERRSLIMYLPGVHSNFIITLLKVKVLSYSPLWSPGFANESQCCIRPTRKEIFSIHHPFWFGWWSCWVCRTTFCSLFSTFLVLTPFNLRPKQLLLLLTESRSFFKPPTQTFKSMQVGNLYPDLTW